MTNLHTDEDIPADEQQFAHDFVEQTMSDWIDAGNSPTSLFMAMHKMVTEIIETCGQPIH